MTDMSPQPLSADDLLAAARQHGRKQATVEAFGLTVTVQALSAAQNALVKQGSVQTDQRGRPQVDWALMERLQMRYGLVSPALTGDQVKTLQLEADGAEWQKIIGKLDELSGTDKQSLQDAEAAFPQADE